MRISLETRSPPPSRGRFQLRPQASRSRVPLAVKRPGGRPWGDVAGVFGLQANRPGDAADGEFSRQHAAGALPAGGAAGEGGCGWWRVVSLQTREPAADLGQHEMARPKEDRTSRKAGRGPPEALGRVPRLTWQATDAGVELPG
jgi:hypothetical protein